MQTPPSVNPRTGTIFLNYRGEGRGEGRGMPIEQDFLRGGDMRINPKLYQKKELFPQAVNEKENYNRMIGDMKKQLNYLDSTKWMYENNNGVLPMDNFTFINL